MNLGIGEKNKKRIEFAGNLLMIAAIVFIVVKGVRLWGGLQEAGLSIRVGYTLWGAIVYSVLVLLLAMIYVGNLSLISNGTSKNFTIHTYCKANLYKYIPGNVFHYVGRNQLAFQQEISQGAVVSASLIEIAMLTFSGLLLSLFFVGSFAAKWIGDSEIPIWVCVFAAVCGIAIAIALLIPQLRRYIIHTLRKFAVQAYQIGFWRFLFSTCVYLCYFTVNGMVFMLLLVGVGYDLHQSDVIVIIGANTFSWLLGFLTPGAPAGLGIREVTMYALLGGTAGSQTILAASLLYRVVTISGDLLAYGFSFLFRNSGTHNR